MQIRPLTGSQLGTRIQQQTNEAELLQNWPGENEVLGLYLHLRPTIGGDELRATRWDSPNHVVVSMVIDLTVETLAASKLQFLLRLFAGRKVGHPMCWVPFMQLIQELSLPHHLRPAKSILGQGHGHLRQCSESCNRALGFSYQVYPCLDFFTVHHRWTSLPFARKSLHPQLFGLGVAVPKEHAPEQPGAAQLVGTSGKS